MKNVLMSVCVFFLMILLLIPVGFSSTDCELAIPRYGVVQCKMLGQFEPVPMILKTVSDVSVGTFPCLSNCKLVSLPQSDCAGWGTHWEVYVNEEVRFSKGSLDSKVNNLDIQFSRGDSFVVKGYCREYLGGRHPISASSIPIKQQKIMLYEGWAGTLPTAPIPHTEGCTLNKIANNYRGDTDISSFFDPTQNRLVTKPSATYENINQMPVNWEEGQSYIFVKDWQTGVADISLTHDKNNNAYWCGGTTGNRKIYNVNKITSSTGKCYAIPQSVFKSNIECCFPADCSWKGTQYTCNPDTWRCEETRWCNSELDCQQVFGEGICKNKKITAWTCNFNKKWGNHAGTCEKKITPVYECPSDCTSDEYYDDEEHKCKPRVVILDCPPGKCCVGGGNYKPKSCSAGMRCCRDSGDVGTCKESCEPVKKTKSSQSRAGLLSTGLATSESSSKPLTQNLPAIIAIVVVVFIAYALYNSQKKTVTITDYEKDEPPKATQSTKKGTFCGKCGSKVKKSAKFCDNCGEKII